MDTITAIVGILFFLWTIAVVVSGKRKPIPSVSAETVKKQEQELVFSKQTEQQKREEIPQKPVQRGKFPAWVNGLSEKELFDLLSAAVKDRTELLIKLGLGGETFWFSGYRTDEGFSCSNDGTDLFPLTFYYN